MNAEPQQPKPGDLSDRIEISAFVRRFYAMVAQDDLLRPMFEDTAHVDWGTHIDKLTDFWCRSLLKQAGYEGNPYSKHKRVHERSPFTHAHFERWLDLFHEAIVSWEGPLVEHAKRTVLLVAEVHSHQITGEKYHYPQDAPTPRIRLRGDPQA